MKLRQFIFIILLILINLFSVFAQELKEGEFWDSFGEGRREIWAYKNFTKDDVIKAQKKRDLIKQSRPKDEWEGIYLSNLAEIGEEVLLWNSEDGFVSYYFYHTLKRLKFGDVLKKNDVLSFQFQHSTAKNYKSRFKTIVKVKIGNLHYLVPEDSMKPFLEDWVGVFPKNVPPYVYSYWTKIDDPKQESLGNLIIPTKYNHLKRSPIKTKIQKVGKRQIYQDKFDDGTVNYEEIFYFITLSDGRSKRIKVGMDLYVEDLGEWIEITKTTAINSIGRIKRGFSDKKEDCRNERTGAGESIPCKKIKVGMTAITKSPFE